MTKRVWRACAAAMIISAVQPLISSVAAQGRMTSANLIVDGNAEAGYCTNDFNAATTLPGWAITHNSPNVMCYTSGPFRTPAGTAPGRGFFGPGTQGDSAATQTIDVSSAGRAIDAGHVTFKLSAWLGGWGVEPGFAVLSARFLGRSGGQLGQVALRTVTPVDRALLTGFVARSTTGVVPVATRSIAVQLQFVASGFTYGYLVPPSGYADNLSLTLSTPVARPSLTPPLSRVPPYDHVFMIMMENSNYSSITAPNNGMPFFHDLMSRGTLMANYHGVYHPSDENYLAVAGGDTYATGAVYWPNIHDPGSNIADELEATSKTWKAYEQGMGSPCNASKATEHVYDKYYFPDDAPFINYRDISDNPKRCQDHLVDTTQLGVDLKAAGTTPAFSWIAADDYYDGEASGNGNNASRQIQDSWLRATITPIFQSPSWTSQRSLLIVTWDEDFPVIGDPDNHVATVLVASQGSVAAGSVSTARYDHYSTGRTIEDALGLGPITANDRYATPLNDAFVTLVPAKR